jgi:hypothetical protein
MIALDPTISYKTREYDFARKGGNDLADGVLTLAVTRGNQTLGSSYALQCERNEEGRVHTVLLAKANSEDGEVYAVELNADSTDAICGCQGFRRHKTCKHADAVLDLIERGQLEEYVAEEPEECVREDNTPPAVLDRRKQFEAIERRCQQIRTVSALLGNGDPSEEWAEPDWVPGSGWELSPAPAEDPYACEDIIVDPELEKARLAAAFRERERRELLRFGK